jgi:hypothetical protein
MCDLMDTAPNSLPSGDDVLAAVAVEFGSSVGEVEDGIDAVLSWMFDEI